MLPFGTNTPDSSTETIKWVNSMDSKDKIALLNKAAEESGMCHVRLLVFCCDIAERNIKDFELIVERHKNETGRTPSAKSAVVSLVETLVVMHGLLTTHPDFVSEVGLLSKKLVYNKMRVRLTITNGLMWHVEPLSETPWCECETDTCPHGWSAEACFRALRDNPLHIGASGFDLNTFYEQAQMFVTEEPEQVEDMDELMSRFELTEEQQEKNANKVQNWREQPAPLRVRPTSVDQYLDPPAVVQRPDVIDQFIGELKGSTRDSRFKPRPVVEEDEKTILSPSQKLLQAARDKATREEAEKRLEEKAELENLRKIVKGLLDKDAILTNETPKRQLKEPRRMSMVSNDSGVSCLTDDDEDTLLTPKDSASVFSRYNSGKQYMSQGTVFTVSKPLTSYDAADSITRLTVQDSLIRGFNNSREIKERERLAVARLKPINGLPKPFCNARLNFLINFHKGLTRVFQKCGPEISVANAVFRCMQEDPVLPVDNFLNQILKATIDKQTCMYASNAFSLPYIEVGMPVTEESLVKCLDLLEGEFKQIWFQEMKDLMVPEFANLYRSFKHELLQPSKVKKSSSRSDSSSSRTEKKKEHKTRSLLGL